MATIPIGTSSPPNLCEGLPLLPVVGQFRAGIASTASSDTIINISSTILFSRLKVSAYYNFLFGLCGPALAFLFQDVQYEVDADSGTLTLTFPSNSNVESGGFVGMEVGGGLNLNVQIWEPDRWYSPWKGHWVSAFSNTVGFSIDFIHLLVELIKYLLQEGAADGLFEQDTSNSLGSAVGLASTYSVSGDTEDPILPDNDLGVTSTITIPFDLVTYTPTLETFANLLKAVKGQITYGPAITFSFPCDLSLNNFTIEGGQGQGSSATYNIKNISGDTVTAVGPAFTSDDTVSRLGTNVTYTGGFDVSLSLYFNVSACKIFSFCVTVPALDLTRLLELGTGNGKPNGGTVETETGNTLAGTLASASSGSCILTPAMSIHFTQGGPPTQTVFVYEPPVTIQVILAQSTPVAATVSLDIAPAAPGFPTSLSIPAGGTSSNTVSYMFLTDCVATGDPDHPGATAPATPTAFTQTYQVTATLTPQPQNSCAVFKTTASVNVKNTYPAIGLATGGGTPGPTPSWGPEQGATINADPSQPPTNTGNSVQMELALVLNFGPQRTGPVTLTLLDEQRVPHTGSDVSVQLHVGSSQWTLKLDPSATVTVTAGFNDTGSIYLQWLSSGPPQNYSNRFFLVVDGGCVFGQNEFWLDVWNWS
jgi:hypothetical protein